MWFIIQLKRKFVYFDHFKDKIVYRNKKEKKLSALGDGTWITRLLVHPIYNSYEYAMGPCFFCFVSFQWRQEVTVDTRLLTFFDTFWEKSWTSKNIKYLSRYWKWWQKLLSYFLICNEYDLKVLLKSSAWSVSEKTVHTKNKKGGAKRNKAVTIRRTFKIP